MILILGRPLDVPAGLPASTLAGVGIVPLLVSAGAFGTCGECDDAPPVGRGFLAGWSPVGSGFLAGLAPGVSPVAPDEAALGTEDGRLILPGAGDGVSGAARTDARPSDGALRVTILRDGPPRSQLGVCEPTLGLFATGDDVSSLSGRGLLLEEAASASEIFAVLEEDMLSRRCSEEEAVIVSLAMVADGV